MDLLTLEDIITLNRASIVARLLAGAVHELNNSLLVIAGSTELLEGPGAAPDALAAGLGRIRSQSARAASAMNEVLQFTRGAPEARGRVSLRETVVSVVALRRYAIGRAGLTIAVTAPEDRAIFVDGQRLLLQQALLNLVMNAEQALAGRKGESIGVELTSAGSTARVRVTDTGPGVADADRQRIFDPLVTSRPRSEASGLGLPAARAIAEMHGGALRIEESAAGAAFVLELPASASGGGPIG